jgi:hypothetical protein
VRADVTRHPGCLRDPGDHPVGVATIDRHAGDGPQDQRTGGPLPAAGLKDAEDWDGQRHGGGLVALAHQMQDPVAPQGLGVVLDADCCGLRGSKRVDSQQVGQGTVVDGYGLGDLKEADQLEPVEALGSGLVAVDLGKPRVDGGVGGDQTVDVGKPEEPANPCIMVVVEDAMSPASPSPRMYSSTWARWIPTSGSRPLPSHQSNQRRNW